MASIEIVLDKMKSNLESEDKLSLIIDILFDLGYNGLSTDSQGVSLLMYVSQSNYKQLSDILLNKYKDIDITNHIFCEPVLIEQQVNGSIFAAGNESSILIQMVNMKDTNGKTALNYASEKDNFDIACSLILHGADINCLNSEQQCALLNYAASKTHCAYSGQYHELRPVVGLLSIKVPEALIHYADAYQYPRLLSYFCLSGHVKVVVSLLDSIKDLDRRKNIINQGDNGWMPLDKVNQSNKLNDYGHLQLVKYLFNNGASVICNNIDPVKATLMSAAEKGHVETFKFLAEKADKTHFNTFIGLAMIDFHKDVVAFIWNNYREYTIDRVGNTALHYAAWRGNIQSVVYLCLNGAQSDVNISNKEGEKPLDNAISSNRTDIIKYLIEVHNAEVGLTCHKKEYESMKKLLQIKKNEANDNSNDLGNTFLHDAIKANDILSAKHLIAKGIDINKANMFGITPLIHSVQSQKSDMTKLLLQNGVVYNSPTMDNQLALNVARGESLTFLSIVHKLFQSSNLFEDLNSVISDSTSYDDPYDPCNPMYFLMNPRDNQGHTLLHKAVALNDNSAVKLILDYNQSYLSMIKLGMKLPQVNDYVPLNISLQDFHGNTPLHIACYKGNIDIINLLLNETPDINIKNQSGQTPVTLAGHCGHKKVVEFLVEKLSNKIDQKLSI